MMSEKVIALDGQIAALLPRLIEVRHDLHQHPELGFEEHRTQEVVRGWLEEHGYTPRDCAETGLVADLKPGEGPTVALRADLDALPMQEDTDLPYRSVHDGCAHKCGHDGHTSILLGVAAVLAQHRETLPGNVRLLFQPAEEGVRGGGARVMVAEKALDGVSEVYGLHNWPAFPRGEVRIKPGVLMAQVDDFDITVRGEGGHAGHPQTCRDPIAAAAAIITGLRGLVSRIVDSQGPAVITVAAIDAGTTYNVIPGSAALKGTIRTFDPQLREQLLSRFDELIKSEARAHDTEAEIDLFPRYPVLVNDAGCHDAVVRVASGLLGAEKVRDEGLPVGGAEDFAFFCREVPSAYFFLGAGDAQNSTPVCHHPDFDFEDELIPLGMRIFLGIVEDRLAALGAS